MVWVASRSLTWQMLVLFFEKKDTSSETGDYCVLFLLWENQVMLWLWVCSNTWDSMIPWDGLNLYEETDSEKITHLIWVDCHVKPVLFLDLHLAPKGWPFFHRSNPCWVSIVKGRSMTGQTCVVCVGVFVCAFFGGIRISACMLVPSWKI